MMVGPVDKSSRKSGSMFSYLDELHLGGIEEKIRDGQFVDGEELARALQAHGLRAPSDVVLAYLCQYLRGKVKRPRGRPRPSDLDRRYRDMVVSGSYRRNLAWLEKRKNSDGDNMGWSLLQGADFWQGTRAEKAARMVARRFLGGAESWRRVQNIASSHK